MHKAAKVSLLLALSVTLILGLAAYAWTQPTGGMGMGMGQGGKHMMNLTPEQAGKLFDLKEKFRNDTVTLRKGLMTKRQEMKALWKAETPDEKAILAKQKEISVLRDQMMEKMVPFRLEAKKIAPQAAFGMGHGMGMGEGCGMGGHGMGGPGMGKGPGMGGPGMTPPAAPPAK